MSKKIKDNSNIDSQKDNEIDDYWKERTTVAIFKEDKQKLFDKVEGGTYADRIHNLLEED